MKIGLKVLPQSKLIYFSKRFHDFMIHDIILKGRIKHVCRSLSARTIAFHRNNRVGPVLVISPGNPKTKNRFTTGNRHKHTPLDAGKIKND